MTSSPAPASAGAIKRARENLAVTVVIWFVAAVVANLVLGQAGAMNNQYRMLVVVAGMSLLPVFFGWVTWREYGLGLPTGSWARVCRIALSCLAVSIIPLLFFTVLFVPRSQGLEGWASAAVMAYLVRLVFSSSSEEFFFRGALQTLANKSWPGKLGTATFSLNRGTVVVAIIFGLIHLMSVASPQGRAVQVGFCILFGLAAGYAKDELNTVWTPVFLHIAVNWFFFLFSLAYFR